MMKRITLFAGLAFSLSSAFGQTVSKTWGGPTQSIDGNGQYAFSLPGVDFTTMDFSPGCVVTDVTVEITFLKTDGSCGSPGIGSSFHGETNFRLQGPTGTQEILAQPNTWSGNTSIGTVTLEFDMAAAVIPTGVPTAGIFLPNTGDLSNYNGTDPIGTWVLQAGDTGAGDPLCVDSYTVTVSVGAPTIAFTPFAGVCESAGMQMGLGGATPAGGVYSGTGITDDGNGSTFSFDPSVAGAGTHYVNYTVSGCGTTTSIDSIEVFALPTISFPQLPAYCVGDSVDTGIGGVTPTGGVFSGQGITDEGNGTTFSFLPSAGITGSNPVYYTVTDMNGCTALDSSVLITSPLPTVTYTAPADLCENAGIQSLGGGTPAGGLYSGTGITDDGNGTTYSFDPTIGTGTYVVTYSYSDANGCPGSAVDSFMVTSVTAATVTGSATELTCDQTGGTYQWVDCNNGNAAVAGATSQSFTPTATGDYAVVYTENGCSDTSACENFISTIGLSEYNNSLKNISVYPNPNNGNFHVSLSNELGDLVELTLTDLSGRLMYQSSTSNQEIQEIIDISNESKGVYFLNLRSSNGSKTIKVIKQ